jgi:uncharacterized membrane protein
LPFSNVLFSEGHSINGSGQVVGTYFTPAFTPAVHGFLDNNGVFSTVDVPGANNTYSYGINNSGEIVGFEQIGSQQIGYLDTNGIFTVFDVPGGTNTVANGINDVGEIVGTFTPAPIPEPTSLVLLASGLTVLGFVIRRRRR